jgi:Ca-activated chloride channel family protein
VLTEVAVSYDFNEMDVEAGKYINRVYPSESVDIFSGGQLVVVGRYKNSGPAKVRLSGRVGKEKQEYEFDIHFSAQGENATNQFAERLWAVRRIGEIIDLLDLRGQNPELVDELVALSMKHGILTPYTSFLADENADPIALSNRRGNMELAQLNLRDLEAINGQSGFAQRQFKQELKMASDLPSAATVGGAGLDFGTGLSPGVGGLDGGGEISEPGLKQTGNATLYKRGKILIADNASEVELNKEKSTIIKIKRFSDEYFELVSDNTKVENELLANQGPDEELIIRLRGKIYQITD